ncbi:sirohydrochlorin chelatase [Streptomyces geranii]|uniref:sirohydrochlorin chelatase n=1 Tax=Streptomyces geranii TaxID=2058923 RepID=UPI000D042D74|nr:sirohydrochlorin chelatase [Streptomyces geranii]
MTPPPPALLIAGHGTRDEVAAEAFREFVRELGRRNPELAVAGGFVGLASPTLGEAVDGLVERGVQGFTAVPLALVAGGGGQGDIPGAYGRALGPHPALLAVLERRVEEALGGGGVRRPGDRADVTVLLVGAGSGDPDANAEVVRAARLLWEGRGYAGVETAFVSLAAPDVPSGLDRCVRLGAGRVVVLPYFLFDGSLPERVRQQTEGWAAVHPEVEVRSAEVIGAERELFELVMERYREVVQGAAQGVSRGELLVGSGLPGFRRDGEVGLVFQESCFHPDDDSPHSGHRHGRHFQGHSHSHAH